MLRSPEPTDIPADPCRLEDRCVDLWYASFSDISCLIPEPEAVLSADERDRAARFRFAQDRLKYVLGRSLLRYIGGRYLDQPPCALQFRYNPHGKPTLAGPLDFNISHSGEMVLLAFGVGSRLGVDIEKIDWDLNVLEIATGFFSEREVADLRSLDGIDRQRAFFRCWTRKEAFLKGLGDGLSLPLGDFDVTVRQSEVPALRRVAWDHKAPLQWQLQEVDIGSESMAAVAVEGFGWEACLRHAEEALCTEA